MKSMGLFGVVGASIIVVAGLLMSLVYGGENERRAILVSGAIALTVQLLAFGIVRLSAGKNVVAGWGLGAILRMLVFVVYALVIVRAFGLPSSAALISMAVFLFASTLVEPLFLKS